jgi:hypothetical protein
MYKKRLSARDVSHVSPQLQQDPDGVMERMLSSERRFSKL